VKASAEKAGRVPLMWAQRPVRAALRSCRQGLMGITNRNEVLKELESIEAELQQLSERLNAARDRFAKLEMRTIRPVSSIVVRRLKAVKRTRAVMPVQS
jgi:predicted nuclease with TOPRIM domain